MTNTDVIPKNSNIGKMAVMNALKNGLDGVKSLSWESFTNQSNDNSVEEL
jgi:hypothetical protein